MFQWGTGTPYSVLVPATRCNCPGVAAVYAAPTGPAGTFGLDARNAFRGPDFHTYNLALSKSIRIAEQAKFKFRGEAFNILNSPVDANPYANLGSPNFGQPSLASSNLVNGSHLEHS